MLRLLFLICLVFGMMTSYGLNVKAVSEPTSAKKEVSRKLPPPFAPDAYVSKHILENPEKLEVVGKAIIDLLADNGYQCTTISVLNFDAIRKIQGKPFKVRCDNRDYEVANIGGKWIACMNKCSKRQMMFAPDAYISKHIEDPEAVGEFVISLLTVDGYQCTTINVLGISRGGKSFKVRCDNQYSYEIANIGGNWIICVDKCSKRRLRGEQ